MKYPGVLKIKKGKFRVRFKITNPHTGEIRQVVRIVTAQSAEEAAVKKAEIRRDMLTEREAEPRQTLGDFAASWLICKKSEVAPSTLATYGFVLDQLDWLGDRYVDAIRPVDIIKWRDGLQVKPATKNGYVRVVKNLCNDAKFQLRLPFDPAEGVRRVREERSREEENSNRLKADELGRVLSMARETVPQWYALFVTLALTGARWGAVTALRWIDVDFDQNEIVIRRAHWKGKVKELKAGNMRRIPMVPLLADALKEHRRQLLEEQDQDKLASGLVFPSEKGTYLKNGSGVNKPWHRVLKAAGIKRRVTFQGLRRTFNNLSRQVAGDIVTRSMTGHVTDAMTEHYSFVESEEKMAAVTSISRLLQGGSGAKGVGQGVGAPEPLDEGLVKG